MEVGLKKDSPITYSNGKRLFTIDQKVDALVRIKMTGCSKAEVARSLHVAESTFRGWFKNKDIVMKAEAKYNEMKTKSSTTSSDGYKSDDNSKSFSVDGSDNNSSTCYTDDREGSRERFSSPDACAVAAVTPAPVVRRSPERHHLHQHGHIHKQKQKKQLLNSTLINNNNNNNNSSSSINNNSALISSGLNASIKASINASIASGLNASLASGLNASGLNASLANGLNASLANGLNASLASGLNATLNASLGNGLNTSLNGLNTSLNGLNASLNGLNGGLGAAGLNAGLGNGLSHLNQQQQLQHHLSQLAHHPLHHNISSLTGLKGSNAAAAAAVAAAAAAAAAAVDHPAMRLTPAELHSKISNYFNPTTLMASTLPGSVNFLTPNFTAAENSYNKSSSFINTMVTATLMEPQALDLSTHSRNKCKTCKPSLTTTTVTSTSNTTTTTQTSPKILRHNSYRNLYKPYKFRCTDDVVQTRQGINPRNPLWPLQ